jgi:hypothetical protein
MSFMALDLTVGLLIGRYSFSLFHSLYGFNLMDIFAQYGNEASSRSCPHNLQLLNKAIQLCVLGSKPCHLLFVAC